jgi:hypothetical protein
MAAAFDTPRLNPYPVIPLVKVDSMAHLKPFVAAGPIQKAVGFPEELVENWQEKAKRTIIKIQKSAFLA